MYIKRNKHSDILPKLSTGFDQISDFEKDEKFRITESKNFLENIHKWEIQKFNHTDENNSNSSDFAGSFERKFSRENQKVQLYKTLKKDKLRLDLLKINTKKIVKDSMQRNTYAEILDTIDETNKIIFVNNLSFTKNNFNFQRFKNQITQTESQNNFYKEIIEYNGMQISIDSLSLFSKESYDIILKDRVVKEEYAFRK